MPQKILKEDISSYNFFDAVKANDEGALRRLYSGNYDKIEKYVLQNNGTTEDAKDIFQEAFIAVWRNIQLDKFYPESENALEGYLYRIAKNKWLDHLRSGHYKRKTGMAEKEVGFEEDSPAEHPEEYIVHVKHEFKNLGDNCREVLTRFYYLKESMRVIAQKFEWTEATAKNNKYRCLQRLRELIQNKINP